MMMLLVKPCREPFLQGLFEARVKGLRSPLDDWSTVVRACPIEAAADAITNARFWISRTFDPHWSPRKKSRGVGSRVSGPKMGCRGNLTGTADERSVPA